MLVEASAQNCKAAAAKLLELLCVHHGKDVAPSPPSSKNWFWMASDPVPVRIEDIKRAVCGHFGITRDDLLSERRLHDVVYPRQLGMFISKCLSGKSYPEIARRFGKSDHTTSRCAFRKIDSLVKTDWKVAYDVALIWEKLS